MASQILMELEGLGVPGSSLRVVDFDVKPGVEKDMGEGDEWPHIRQQVLEADIIVIVSPTWMGQVTSVAQRVLERLDAELGETDDHGRPILFDKVAVVGVVGNEDGAHHITSQLMQALNDVGFTIPAQGGTYWNGEAMNKVDYIDLKRTPDTTAAATKTAAANAAHLATALREAGYPAS
jgi:multimeric flavodoxin WrbA